MKNLFIDIETYSEVDIKKSGSYKYIEDDSFEILLIAYAVDNEPVRVIDMVKAKEDPAERIRLSNFKYLYKTERLHAHNANFERTALDKFFGYKTPIERWHCTMALTASCGLPLSLDKVSEVLELEHAKLKSGKALINYFTKPCKPTKTNGTRTRNLPEHSPEKWEEFKEYCRMDVEAEREIYNQLKAHVPTETERQCYILDQQINDFGVGIDLELAEAAIEIDECYKSRLTERVIELTGVDNPGSRTQLMAWLNGAMDSEVTTLRKADIPELMKETDCPEVMEVLKARQGLSKTSTKKYVSMIDATCKDSRAHGLLQYYGANRTGRWCLTGDHEVLTLEGWVRLDSWEGGKIVCWNKDLEIFSFQKSNKVMFDYEGDMYNIDCQRCDQISTPEHRMPVWTKYGWSSEEVQNLTKRFETAFVGSRQTNNFLDNDDIRVLIMTQADGHYTDEGALKFHFSKERKIQRCKTLLRKAQIPFIEQPNKATYTISVRKKDLPLYLRMFSDKIFGYWLLNENADIIFDELEQWDGYRRGPNSIQYSTVVKQNADIMQSLAALSGRSATMITKNRDHEKWQTSYILNVWLTPGKTTHIRRENITKSEFSGKVYCAETETGFFMVRRNGKVWITGNSGRLIQTQNLPQNHLNPLDFARNLAKEGDLEGLDFYYGDPADTLSQLIRTAFVPQNGNRFVTADFSAIEARVIAWLADERWRLEVFATHGKIYEASAAMMFNVPIESVTKGSELRAKGKVSELALGYSGGVSALKTMGGEKMGLSEDEMLIIVNKWRKASPNIVKFWYAIGNAFLNCVKSGTAQQVKVKGSPRGIIFRTELRSVTAELPSGRKLFYWNPEITINRFGNDSVRYMGMNQTTKQWEWVETYHGKAVENLTQAIARDLLMECMLKVNKKHPIVMHIHDELVTEVASDRAEEALKELCDIMAEEIPWAKGLPLRGEGFISEYYRKD